MVAAWFPFTKNMSSGESIFFVSNAVIVSPMEVLLATTVLSWFVRWVYVRDKPFRRGEVLAPLMVLTTLVVIGFAWGIARGGDMSAALWEARPLFYVGLLYVLITNLLDRFDQYDRLLWLAFGGITLHSLFALQHRSGLDEFRRSLSETLIEHPAAVHINLLIMALLAVYLLRGSSFAKRVALPFMAIPTVTVFVFAERRAAFVALGAGVVLFAMILFHRNRRAFNVFVPIVVVVGIGYTMAFWNSTTGIGFGAQAVKGVIAPGSLSAEDQSSNLYRQIENFNVWYTIRTSPIFGIGFGHAFYRPVALAELSSFPFQAYITHNALVWMWLKTGFAGLASVLSLFAIGLRAGIRSIFVLDDNRHALLPILGTLYVGMYLAFTFVDISWDTRSLVFLAVALGMCTEIPRSVESSAVAARS